MKIGLIGAPCTGKTTLAKAVAEKLKIPAVLESFDSAVKHCVFNSKDRMFGAPPETWPEYFDRVWREGLYDEVIDFTKAIAIDIK